MSEQLKHFKDESQENRICSLDLGKAVNLLHAVKIGILTPNKIEVPTIIDSLSIDKEINFEYQRNIDQPSVKEEKSTKNVDWMI
jgi:hypothetical protein